MNENAHIYSSDMDAWKRVGRAVAERRSELGLGQRAAGSEAGLGLAFWNRLEGGKQDRFRRMNIGRVERFLGWEPGTIERILHEGAEPVVMSNERALENPAAAAQELMNIKAQQEDMQRQLEELRQIIRSIGNAWTALNDGPRR